MFPVHITPGEFINATITRLCWISVWWRLGQGNPIMNVTAFTKSFDFKMFSVHTTTKNRLLQIPPIWREFSTEKLRFSVFTAWRISVDGRPNRRNKAASVQFLRRSLDLKASNRFNLRSVSTILCQGHFIQRKTEILWRARFAASVIN